MKKQILILISFIALSLSSCETNNPNPVNETDPNSFSNYWEANTLVHSQLYGKVKSVSNTTEGVTTTDNYTETGYISKTSVLYNGLEEDTRYYYTKPGVLDSIITTINGYKSRSIIYQYQNTGQYTLADPYNFTGISLVKNLKSISYMNGAVCSYISKGDIMQIIDSYKTSSDTTFITYSGNYPISISSSLGSRRKDITYYNNGMFKSYTDSYWSSTSSSESKYYFKADDKFQLLDSVSVTSTVNSSTTHYTETLKYNDNKDLIFKPESGLTREYSYVYDSHKNWIKRTCILRDKDDPNGWLTIPEERTITYWQ